jgi:hypothetical protein
MHAGPAYMVMDGNRIRSEADFRLTPWDTLIT